MPNEPDKFQVEELFSDYLSRRKNQTTKKPKPTNRKPVTKKGCPFCEYSGPSQILTEYDGVFFIEPLNPVTPGHVLAIPRQHVPHALADPEVTGQVMAAAARFAWGECNIITSVGRLATQTVDHLHVHIVPRRKRDGLALPWDPGHTGTDG